MDFDLDSAQRALLVAVEDTIYRTNVLRAQDTAREGKYDAELDRLLQREVDISRATLLDPVLIAERLAELGTATTFGLRAVLGSMTKLRPGPVVKTDRQAAGPVRFATVPASLVLVDGDKAFVSEIEPDAGASVKSSYGLPFGRVDRVRAARGTSIGEGTQLRALWRLTVAAEMAGNAATAIALTAEHLRTREQFGRPLSFFHALRHRLADAAVTAEANRWMVREAANVGDARSYSAAAFYAIQGAAAVVPELVQMSGARSFTTDFEVQMYVMRLAGLWHELGGEDRLASAVLAQPEQGGPVGEPVSRIAF